MMGKLTLILFAAVLVFVSPLRGQTVSEIPVLPGEKWWGMFAGNSPEQPLGSFRMSTGGIVRSGFCTGHLVSSAGRYIHVDETALIDFDEKKFTITTDGIKVSAEKAGRTMRQAYLAMQHSDFHATNKFPSPEFFSNIVYETQADFGFLQTADDILAYARRLIDEGFPPGIMVLSDGWRDAAEADFDKRYYPDPKAFVDEMHRLGFKVMLTVRPYMGAYGAEYARFGKSGLFVGQPEQGVWTMSLPEGVCAVVDVRNQQTAAAIKTGLRGVTDKYGVDGFRMDCLDFIDRYYIMNGNSSPAKESFLKAWRQIGADFALCEFMPGVPEYQTDYISSIHTPYFIQGDYLVNAVTVGLAAGPFTFVEPTTDWEEFPTYPEITDKFLVRSALMQALMPVGRVAFAPWKYTFAADEMKRALKFRASITEYMSTTYAGTCKTVEPMIRPMEYMFPNAGFADCSDQYMLGEKYLVAPALDDSPKRMVRLPKGTWRDMDGKKHKGPMVLQVETGGYKMAWFELSK